MTRAEVFELIDVARNECDERWGTKSLNQPGRSAYTSTTILLEEVGEVARAVLESDSEGLRNELLDVAQVAVAWLESL